MRRSKSLTRSDGDVQHVSQPQAISDVARKEAKTRRAHLAELYRASPRLQQ